MNEDERGSQVAFIMNAADYPHVRHGDRRVADAFRGSVMMKLRSTLTLLFALVAGAGALTLPAIAAAQQYGPPPPPPGFDHGPGGWGPPPPPPQYSDWRDRDDGDYRPYRWQDNAGNWHMPNGRWVDPRGHWHDSGDEHWRSRSWNRRQALYARRGWDEGNWR